MAECWFPHCDGNHDVYMHPVHVCKFPAKAHGIRNTIEFRCETCGKRWRNTRKDWRSDRKDGLICSCGWELLAEGE